MFWNKKKTINSDEYLELSKKINNLEIDLVLMQDQLMKAIKKKVVKKEEEEETKDNKNVGLVPV